MNGMHELSELERQALPALLELAEMERSGNYEPSTLMLGPWTAYTLVCALQLATRHPGMQSVERELLKSFARPIQQVFDGPLAELLKEGWNPDRDVPMGAPQ